MIEHVKMGKAQHRGTTRAVGPLDERHADEAPSRPDAMAKDLRATQRVETSLTGILLLEGNAATIECLVRDLSEVGAKIEVDPSRQITPNFTLNVPELSTAFRAELRWRYAQTVGVKFIGSRPLTSTELHPTRAELIAEIAQLRETVRTLTERLTQLGERVVDGAVLRGRVPQRLKRIGDNVDTPPERTPKGPRPRRGEGATSAG